MIIQCPECQTRFRMADDKLKPEGTRVRCSRCRHIFAVTPPAEESHSVAPPPPPAPSPDKREEEIDFGSFNMQSVEADPQPESRPEPAATPAPAQPASVDSFDLGLESPSFAAGDSAPSDPAQEDAPFSFDTTPEEEENFSFDGPAGEADDTFSFDQPAAGGETGFAFDQPPPAGSDEIAFDEPAEEEAGGTFVAPMQEDPFAAGEFSFAEAPEEEASDPAATGLATEFSFGEMATESEETAETEEFSLEGNSFSFEENESDWNQSGEENGFALDEEAPAGSAGNDEFDFSNLSFGEEDTPQVATAPPPRPEPRPEPEAPAVRLESPPAAPERDPAPLPILPRRRGRRRSPISGVLVFVVLLLLGLSGAAGYFFWQKGLPAPAELIDRLTGQTMAAAPEGQIRVTDLHGYFVANREAGQLFVIQGKAVNEFKEARSAIAVKGILYDRNGKPILQQTVFSGNSLQEPDLLTIPFTQIEERMNNQFGDSLSNLNVGTGKAIPFTIVFRNLPSDLAEFTVEVADSRPGSG